MRTQILLFLLFLFSQTALTQQGTFIKLIGKGIPTDVIIDKSENYIISGMWHPDFTGPVTQIWLMKVSSEGDSVFQKLLLNPEGQYAYGIRVLQTKGGTYLVACQVTTPTPSGINLHDLGLVKYSLQGDSLGFWRYDINQERHESIYSINTLTDSTILFIGQNEVSALFLMLDTNGNVRRTKTYPALRFSSAYTYDSETIFVFADQDTVVGSTHYRKLIILKANMNGDSLGAISLTPAYRSRGMGTVIRMPDGFFALGTTYWDSLNIENSVFRKIDSQGRMIWEWRFPADNWRTTALAGSPDTGIIFLQYSQLSPRQIRLCKINKNGALAWQRVIQLPSYVENGRYNSLVVAKDGYILVTGYIETLWERKIFLLKTTSEGYVNVGVEEEAEYQPQRFSLEQNYPNPFNPVTTIRYSIRSEQPHPRSLSPQDPVDWEEREAGSNNVRLTLYDILGREVATLVDEEKAAGTYTVTFNAAQLPSGTYFYELRAGGYRAVRKMVLLK